MSTDDCPLHKLEIRHTGALWGSHAVLNDISLEIKSGDFHFLSGPNGSGKSTLLTLLSRVQIPNLKTELMGTEAGIFLDGKDINSFKRKALSQKVAYLSQNEACTWDYSVKEAVLFGRFCRTQIDGHYTKQDYMVTESVLEKLGIQSLAQRSITELSGGEWQKVRIARALCQEPDFLLLDEPVANLDFSYQTELLNLLKKTAQEDKIGILISIHDLNTAARFAKTITLLSKLNSQNTSQNQYFTGTVSDTMTEEVLSQTYGVNFKLYPHPADKTPQVYL